MSYFQHSDELPAWIAAPPANWGTDWLKWNVQLCTERPSEDEVASLPYIANEHIASWTGQLIATDLQPVNADSRKFEPNDVLFNKLRPYLAKVYQSSFEGVCSGELLCLRPTNGVVSRYLFYVVSSKAFVGAVDAETFGSKMPRADWEIVGHQPLPLPTIETQKRIVAFLDEKTAKIDALIAKKQALLERLAEKRQAIITQAVTKSLDPAATMKDSGIDWLGEIPAHWQFITLNKVTTKITNGYVGPTRDLFVDDGVRYIQSLHVKRNRIVFGEDFFVEKEWSLRHAKSILKAGDVLIVQTGDIGQVAWVSPEHEGCNCHALIVCSCREDQLEGRFLSWLLNSDYGQFYLHSVKTGALHPHLNCGNVKFFGVLIPPLDEQKAISNYVDSRVAEIDEAYGKIEDSIIKLSEFRNVLIVNTVTGKFDGLR